MQKIAIFLTALDGGGAERVMINLARGFVERGIEVDLVLVKAEGPYLSQVFPNVRIINLNKSRLLSSIPSLIKYLKTEKPTALLTALDTNIIAILVSQLSGVSVPVMVTVHNNLTLESQNATQLKRKLTPQLARLFYPYADKIITVSQGVAEDLIEIGLPQEKISVIYNPIVTPDLEEKLTEPVTHPWFLPEEPPVILAVGRLTKQKNFEMLIRSLALVKQELPARLAILGEGEEQENLHSLATSLGVLEDVAFLGFVNNPYSYMGKAALLVLSSAWEGFGNVLVEAMAAGTPVVSTDCPSGPREILENGKYGRLVAVDDIQGMAKAIIEVLNHSANPEELKQQASKFSLARVTQEYLDALK